MPCANAEVGALLTMGAAPPKVGRYPPCSERVECLRAGLIKTIAKGRGRHGNTAGLEMSACVQKFDVAWETGPADLSECVSECVR
eukprot:3161749-Rhodomonas_salina.1